MSRGTSTGSLAAGFAALRTGRLLVFLLILPTVVLSLLAVAPLGPSLSDSLAGTLAGDHLLRNHPAFAPADYFDFLREKAPAVAGMLAAARWAALLILLQQIFFAGGLVAVLGRSARVSLPDLVAGAKRNFWHNLKCFAIFIAGFGVAFGAWFALTRAFSKKAFENTPPGAWSAFLFRLLVVLGALSSLRGLLPPPRLRARRPPLRPGDWRLARHGSRLAVFSPAGGPAPSASSFSG